MKFPERPVQIITKELVEPQKKMQIFYPEVINMEDTVVQQKINNTIINNVYKLLADQNFYEIEDWNNIDGWYEVKTNEREVLSIVLYNYAFPYHYAHGLTLARSLTFDTKSGKKYSLGEMFKPDSNYTQVFSDKIKQQIKERDISLIKDFEEIKPDQDYYIADRCLVVYFQIYEYTAYVAGFQNFPISVYEIEDIVEEKSPLGRMIPDYYVT